MDREIPVCENKSDEYVSMEKANLVSFETAHGAIEMAQRVRML